MPQSNVTQAPMVSGVVAEMTGAVQIPVVKGNAHTGGKEAGAGAGAGA